MNLKKLYKFRYTASTSTSTSNPKRKGTRIVRLGKDAKRSWRIRSLPKFRVKSLSPLTQWNKFKNTFKSMMMMVNFTRYGCGNSVASCSRRISGSDDRVELLAYDKNEYENRMMYEIYKSLVASIELNSKYRQRMSV